MSEIIGQTIFRHMNNQNCEIKTISELLKDH